MICVGMQTLFHSCAMHARWTHQPERQRRHCRWSEWHKFKHYLKVFEKPKTWQKDCCVQAFILKFKSSAATRANVYSSHVQKGSGFIFWSRESKQTCLFSLNADDEWTDGMNRCSVISTPSYHNILQHTHTDKEGKRWWWLRCSNMMYHAPPSPACRSTPYSPELVLV